MKFSRTAEELITAFRGMPPDRSRAVVRQPVELDGLVNVIFEEYKIEEPGFEQALMGAWQTIAGETAAHRSSPARLGANGVMVIAAGNSTLRQELSFRKQEILEKIRAIPGGEKVVDLRFTAG